MKVTLEDCPEHLRGPLTQFQEDCALFRAKAEAPYTLSANPMLTRGVDACVRTWLEIIKHVYSEHGWDKDGTVEEFPVRTLALDLFLEMTAPAASEKYNDPAALLLRERMTDTVGVLDRLHNETDQSKKRMLRTILKVRGLL